MQPSHLLILLWWCRITRKIFHMYSSQITTPFIGHFRVHWGFACFHVCLIFLAVCCILLKFAPLVNVTVCPLMDPWQGHQYAVPTRPPTHDIPYIHCSVRHQHGDTGPHYISNFRPRGLTWAGHPTVTAFWNPSFRLDGEMQSQVSNSNFASGVCNVGTGCRVALHQQNRTGKTYSQHSD